MHGTVKPMSPFLAELICRDPPVAAVPCRSQQVGERARVRGHTSVLRVGDRQLRAKGCVHLKDRTSHCLLDFVTDEGRGSCWRPRRHQQQSQAEHAPQHVFPLAAKLAQYGSDCWEGVWQLPVFSWPTSRRQRVCARLYRRLCLILPRPGPEGEFCSPPAPAPPRCCHGEGASSDRQLERAVKLPWRRHGLEDRELRIPALARPSPVPGM